MFSKIDRDVHNTIYINNQVFAVIKPRRAIALGSERWRARVPHTSCTVHSKGAMLEKASDDLRQLSDKCMHLPLQRERGERERK
jgi:hypothetical protein